MKAVRFHEYGGPEVLRVEEVDVPSPARGRCWCASPPRRSTASKATSGRGGCRARCLELPHTPGLDVAGTVEALGEGVDGCR